MKVGRLLGTVVSILLMLSFIRAVNGAPFIGVSEVLVRLDQFEFDLDPVSELVDTWQSVRDSDSDRFPAFGADSDSMGSDSGFVGPDETDLNVLQKIWYFLRNLGSSIVTSFRLIGVTLSYLWTDGLSLVSIPIDVFLQTWSFVLWLLGFTV